MLTVGRREDGRKGIGLGFGGRMEENELEEGEAFSGHEEETSSPEKDLTNLSYIDEKLHDVLGHFQKDFEGGVSAENLGAMFGGYGSFLPTYQRSPSVWAHPTRSPANASSRNGSKSPCSTALMGMRHNPTVLSVAINKTCPVEGSSAAPSLDKSCKDSRMNATISADSIPQQDSIGTNINGSDQKTLKVRIKVGPESASARNKAAIYSGLGLDISPSSSPEDSPYVSEDHSPDCRDAPDESPLTIIQIMTCFAVPEGFVLSPLHDSLLHLKEKENFSLKNVWTNMPNVVTQVTSVASTDMPPSTKDGKNHLQKKMKSLEKNGRTIDARSSSCKGDVSSILKRETDTEVLDGQDAHPDVSNFASCSVSRDIEGKEGRQGFGESLKGSKIHDLSLDPNKISVKGRLSSSDAVKDNQLYLVERFGNTAVGTSANEPTFSKGNLGSKTNLPEQVQGERGTSNHKDASVDIQKEGRGKPEKFFDTPRSDPDENMEIKDLGVQYAEPANQNSAHKVNLYEQDEEIMFQTRKQASEGKGKWKKSQTNGAPSSRSMKKNPKTSSSMKIKEKKTRPPSKGECRNDKLKELKFRDECRMNQYKESHVELGDTKAELAEDRTKLVHVKDKMMGIKHENEYHLASDEKAKERPVVRMMDNPPISEAVATASIVTPMALNNPASDAVVAPAPSAPVVIEENWVGCDKCQKWRLLPYGTNPGLLPKKWQCNMLNWLAPGMNKCSISEEETTKALHALYQIPVSQCNINANGVNAVASNTVLAEGQFLNHTFGNNATNLPAVGKKKHKLKDPSNLVNGPALLQGSTSVKKNQQVSVKSRSLNDVNVNRYLLESNMLSKTDLDHANNPTDFAVDKQKHKDEVKSQILGHHSDGGDFVGSAGRPSKFKSKREVDQDGFTTSKKFKKEELNYASEGWHSDYEGAGNLLSAEDNALPTDVSKHNMQNYNGYSSSKAEGILPTSSKKVKVQTQALSNGEVKDHVNGSNLERSRPGFISKKRKNKVSQETNRYPQSIHGDQHFMDSRVDAREAFSENELKREKKLKVLKPEVKDSSTRKADGRLENKGRPTKILFSGSRQHPTYGMENDGFAVKEEHREQFQVTAMPRQASEGMESFRKDSAYAQSSAAAATSSSSKVSSSRKSRGNFQETRGSPVESVSSSPFRNSNLDKLLPSRRKFERKDDAFNAGLSAIGSPKNYSDGEIDAGSERPERMKDNASSLQGRSHEGHRAIESRGLDSMRGKYDYKDNEANKPYEVKDKDGLHLTLFGDTHDDFSPTDFEGRNLVNAIAKHDKYEPLDKDHFRDLDKMNSHHLANGSMQRKSCKGSSHSREKHSSKSGADRSKIKVPGSVSKQVELLSAKNDPDSEDMVRSASHDNYCKDFKHGNGNCVFPEKDVEDVVKKESLVKLSFVGGRESHSDRGKQGNLEAHGSGIDKQQRDGNSRETVSGTGDGKSMLQDITQRDPHVDDKKLIGRSEMALGRGKSHPVVSCRDKQETQNRGNQSIPTVKGGKSEICPIDATNGDPKVIKSRKPDEENGTHQISLRQATPSRPDHRSPVRRDGQSAANVLKEARDLKHTANRLKSEGLELESTGLYFQAAMKFLYYASLLEPPHIESARHGEGTQSVQMYSETARLCEFCAHEYERCKKMAAAALAYKCVEVAYMKVSYFKHSCASKDRNELQTALHMAVPGESPSSSASDVDNLNNQVTLDKSTSARGVSSPQVAGNHVVAARNRPNFVRLLNYANETVCAFDASRKMQLAFAAAGSGLDKDSIGRLSSVKKVIDFNFHDVERLLQLIRFSMESISC